MGSLQTYHVCVQYFAAAPLVLTPFVSNQGVIPIIMIIMIVIIQVSVITMIIAILVLVIQPRRTTTPSSSRARPIGAGLSGGCVLYVFHYNILYYSVGYVCTYIYIYIYMYICIDVFMSTSIHSTNTRAKVRAVQDHRLRREGPGLHERLVPRVQAHRASLWVVHVLQEILGSCL